MGPDALDLAPRRQLLATLRAHPGLHLRELARASGMAEGVLRHHLDQLLDAKLVEEQRDGRLRRFFPAEIGPTLRAAIAPLRVRQHRAVLVHLLNHAPATTREIASALRLAPRSASHYLRALVDAGVVTRERDAYRVVDPRLVVDALVAYKPSFADRLVDAALELWFDSA
jgi:DNA-binding transcriptional ArsR family regulator